MGDDSESENMDVEAETGVAVEQEEQEEEEEEVLDPVAAALEFKTKGNAACKQGALQRRRAAQTPSAGEAWTWLRPRGLRVRAGLRQG